MTRCTVTMLVHRSFEALAGTRRSSLNLILMAFDCLHHEDSPHHTSPSHTSTNTLIYSKSSGSPATPSVCKIKAGGRSQERGILSRNHGYVCSTNSKGLQHVILRYMLINTYSSSKAERPEDGPRGVPDG